MFLIIFYVYILIFFLNNADSKTKQDKFTNKQTDK